MNFELDKHYGKSNESRTKDFWDGQALPEINKE
jgi:hypothetical protein